MASSPFGKFWRILLLLMVLFGLPSLSWIFLQKGLNTRLSILQELDSLGVVPVCLPLAEDSLVAPQEWKSNTWFVAFQAADSSSLSGKDMLEKIYGDLSEKTRLSVLIFSAEPGQAVVEHERLQGKKDWFELRLDSLAWKALAVEGFHWPVNDMGYPQTSFVALVNEQGVILNLYDLRKEDEIKKLIVHTAFINQKE